MLKSKSKKKEKKKKQIKFEILPQKHKRENNLNYYSEEVVKEIIDKIISLSFSKLFENELKKNIPNFCVNAVQNTLNNFMKIFYINYDIDDSYNILNSLKYSNSDEKRYKFKRYIKANARQRKLAEIDLLSLLNKNKDLQIDMIIKEKNISDYFSSSFEKPKNIYIKPSNTLKYDTKKSQNNFWGFIAQPKSLASHRFLPQSTAIFPLPQTSNQIKEEEDNLYQNKKKSKYYKFFKSKFIKDSIKNSKKDSIFEEIPLKKRIFSIFKMNSLKKIEDENPKPVDTPEIIELRRLKLEEIKKLKEEEELRKQKLDKKKMENKAFNINDIKINIINKDKNKIIDQKKYIEEQIKKGNFTTDADGNIVLINKIEQDQLIEDLPIIYSKYKEIQKESNNNDLEQEKKIIELQQNIISNSVDKNKRRVNFIDYRNKNSLKTNSLNYRNEPSGSNFELIQPEVGVIIQEKNKSKSGGNKFFEKYKKFSINDFNKTLKETMDNERKDFKEKMMEAFNKTADLKNLIAFNTKIKNINNISTIKNQKEKNLFEKTFTDRIRKEKKVKTKNINNIFNSLNKSQSGIFLKNKKYSLMENLFVYDDSEHHYNKIGKEELNKINQKNLFLKKLNRNQNNMKNSFSYRLMDSFNKSIILGSRNSINNNNIPLTKISSLPIIPLKSFKRNKSFLSIEKISNSTNTNFLRTRIKKV